MLQVPGYKIVRLLSAGGFGHVHLAQRDTDGLLVAIKFLHDLNDDHVRRFYREAKILHQHLGNPYVVRLFHSEFQSALPYIVMEYCSGGSLRSWVGKNIDWLQVAAALSNAAAGLSKIHEVGGFHRDVKPDNLLIAENDDGSKVIKVGDFGVARVPRTSTQPMTRSAWGTEGYMAPEIMLGREFTKACDVYSLGITGLELLTGTRDPATLRTRSDIPQQLRELLFRMISPQAMLRPTIDACQECFGVFGRDEIARRLRQAEQEARERQVRERVAQEAKALQVQEAQARQAQNARARQIQEVQARQKEARAQQIRSQQAAAAAAGTIGVGGLALLLGGIALATMNSRDQNGRYRGSDGRFRSGRWG